MRQPVSPWLASSAALSRHCTQMTMRRCICHASSALGAAPAQDPTLHCASTVTMICCLSLPPEGREPVSGTGNAITKNAEVDVKQIASLEVWRPTLMTHGQDTKRDQTAPGGQQTSCKWRAVLQCMLMFKLCAVAYRPSSKAPTRPGSEINGCCWPPESWPTPCS